MFEEQQNLPDMPNKTGKLCPSVESLLEALETLERLELRCWQGYGRCGITGIGPSV